MGGTNYLIDFENVHDAGIQGMNKLTQEDCVYLFYTEHADKISLDVITGVTCPFRAIKVAYGKQSLDMHLVSYLGYLLGQEKAIDDRYIIVSKDTDFAGVTRFWCNAYGMPDKIQVQPTLIKPVQPQSILMDAEEKKRLGLLMQQILISFGERDADGVYRARMASLCTKLNLDEGYVAARKRTGLKAVRYLEEFSEYIQVRRIMNEDWAYIVPLNEPASSPAPHRTASANEKARPAASGQPAQSENRQPPVPAPNGKEEKSAGSANKPAHASAPDRKEPQQTGKKPASAAAPAFEKKEEQPARPESAHDTRAFDSASRQKRPQQNAHASHGQMKKPKPRDFRQEVRDAEALADLSDMEEILDTPETLLFESPEAETQPVLVIPEADDAEPVVSIPGEEDEKHAENASEADKTEEPAAESGMTEETGAAGTTAEEKSAEKEPAVPEKAEEPVAEAEETETSEPEPHTEIDPVRHLTAYLTDNGFETADAEKLAEILLRNLGGRNGKLDTYGQIMSKFGHKTGLMYYRKIKEIMSSYRVPVAPFDNCFAR